MEKRTLELIDSCCFVLGYLIGKGGINDPAAIVLAKALKQHGVESTHIDAVVKANTT